MKKVRIDELLLTRDLADTLSEAQSLIMAGQVIVDDQRVDKVGALVGGGSAVRVRGIRRFVSRGGDKLAAALKDLGLEELVKGARVLDVGASTGGFTDCCLSLGAATVVTVDVGTNQLDWSLRRHPRVTVYEGVDIRTVDFSGHGFDIVVADISFNSLERILPAVISAVNGADCHFLVMIKPQFELERGLIPEGGVVTDQSDRAQAVEKVKKVFTDFGFSGFRCVESRVPGRRGNVEIFLHVEPSRKGPLST